MSKSARGATKANACKCFAIPTRRAKAPSTASPPAHIGNHLGPSLARPPLAI
jgi:hypothetical protein